MRSEMKIKALLVSLAGNILIGAGVALNTGAQLGTDPSVSFSQAASNMYGISLGTMVTITNVFLAIVVFFINKKNIGVSTLMVIFLNQYPINFFSSFIKQSEYLYINIMYIISGCILVAIGCDLIINAKLGMGIYDAFIFSLSDKFNIDFVKIRYVVDAVFFILTYLFKGFIGIGTILCYILTGNLMKVFMGPIEKIIKIDNDTP